MKIRTMTGPDAPTGGFTELDGEEVYCIAGYDRMPPFLMTLASDSDLWMFVSSAGGLTAGRVDPDRSLFPYETVDKLHDGHHHTGPVTLLRVGRKGRPEALWQPFDEHASGPFHIARRLYKNTAGNRLTFEEINEDLDLVFRYRWSGSETLGWVRTATLENRGASPISVRVLDGLRNLLPYGVHLALQQQSSCLVDAYKRSEHDPETGLGIFALTAAIVDRAEPAEMLRANTVWCQGLDGLIVCLSIEGVAAFRNGEALPQDAFLGGRRGNYLAVASFELAADARRTWHLVANVGQSHAEIAALRQRLLRGGDLGAQIESSLREATEGLVRNVAAADGLQSTGSTAAASHHFANALFNVMRGGVFAQNGVVPRGDFVQFLHTRNRAVAAEHAACLAGLPEQLTMPALLEAARRTADADLERLCFEYLPLSFGRRHGDPSRPWNRFAVHVRNPDGSRALRYEGNWRDIFQNWEALAVSFPGFLPHFVAKFVNASTVDGFNPYRLTRDGIDWEVADPDDPWSYIGYWGDHQIVYLLKLLEALAQADPGALEALLGREIFTYADVPYRIEPYVRIAADPRATIVYDRDAAARIDARVQALGTDGKLLCDAAGHVVHVHLLEKLLVPALAKLSNLVPDGGIWMNTQRPEWNDANNALAGHGLSMVTLCYLRRYLLFLERLLDGLGSARTSLSTEVLAWFRKVHAVLAEEQPLLDAPALADADRRRILDALGTAFSEYRDAVYAHGFSGKETLEVAEIVALCRDALEYLDHAIHANQREDGLYHAYNLLVLPPGGAGARVRTLYEMLEGQVAALSSGVVGAKEAVRLVTSLFESPLYRPDQRSFMLYPARELPGFLAKNVVPDPRIQEVPLLQELLQAGETSILQRDASDVCRFHGDFRNASDVAAALDRLTARPGWAASVQRDRQAVLDVFEAVFDHRAFTGRSGTMYAYEGLGSVYWHMVAKLLLAVQEIVFRADHEGQPAAVVESLAKAYFRVRSGLGFEKTVAEYGAFPMDPYSHTPAHGGAQQPGMTGQVKEEILTRFGELGLRVEEGAVRFRPLLLRREEFRSETGRYRFYDLEGRAEELEVPAGGLAFSYCQTPVFYRRTTDEAWVRVTVRDGEHTGQLRIIERSGDRLEAAFSRELFARRGTLVRLDVGIPDHALCRVGTATRERHG